MPPPPAARAAARAAARGAGAVARQNAVKGAPKAPLPPPPAVGTSRPSAPSAPSPPSPSSPPEPPSLSPAEIAALKEETKKKWRRITWTLAFAAVTFTGTIYGAGLKTQQEWKAEKKKVQEATIDDRVAFLEQHKADLMRQKREIESKLGELRARMAANAQAEASVEDGGDSSGGGGGGGGGGQGTR